MTTAQHDLVRPSSPTAIQTWPLSPIDRFAFQWVIQGTWVFDAPLDADALKHGLARLLAAYPILCGRAAGENIRGSDRGVPFVEASDRTSCVADFGAARVEVARFGHRFSPASIRHGRAPLLTVKLTRLRDGCVLAICCSHACLDGNGFYSMARNLSLAATGKPFPPPVLEREAVPAKPRGRWAVARSAREQGWHRLTVLALLRSAIRRRGLLDRAFVARFSPVALRRCKEALTGAPGCERLSTNTALLAHVAHRVAELVDLGPRDDFAVSLTVDQRERIASIRSEFARNAVSAVATGPIPATASEAEIAARLQERLEPLTRKPSTVLESLARLTDEVAAHALPYSTIPVSRLGGRRPTLFYTNTFSKFPVYALELGTESRPVRPVRAVPHNLGDPILIWPAPPAVGGVELYFSGTLARAAARLDADDGWWAALRRFDREVA